MSTTERDFYVPPAVDAVVGQSSAQQADFGNMLGEGSAIPQVPSTDKIDIDKLFGKFFLEKETPSDKLKVKLTADSEVFKADDGSTIVYRRQTPSRGDLFYSPDGKNFFEMNATGFGGTSTEHHVSFTDPHDGDKEYDIERKGDEIRIGDKVFKKTATPEEIEAKKLPEVREREYMFKLADGSQLYVSHDKYNYDFKTLKLFIGKPGEQMRELKIEDVTRFSDGGTTYIKTPEGVLFVPSPLGGRRMEPSWNGEPITESDPTNFEITEDKSGVKIKPKK